MRIAVLGWGSLIWDQPCLRTEGEWHQAQGPELPIEFARISNDRRLTLVLLEGAEPQPTAWVLSAARSLEAARANLACREGTSVARIGTLRRGEQPTAMTAPVGDWIERAGVDAVIWTGLDSNWCDERGVAFSAGDALAYLRGLRGEVRERAQEYIERAPSWMRTKVRERVEQELGWYPRGEGA